VCRLRELQRSGRRVEGNCILLMDFLGSGIRTAPGERCNHFALGCDGQFGAGGAGIQVLELNSDQHNRQSEIRPLSLKPEDKTRP
jgi:hypothetical protein